MASNVFIKFETPAIEGESTSLGHEKDIQVLAWSHSFNQPTSPVRSSAGSGTVEKANHSDFSMTIYADSSLDDLLKCCWNGTHIGKATLAAYRADGDNANAAVKYLEVVMEHVVVSNVSLGGGGGDIPTVSVSMSYGKVTYTYTASKGDEGSSEGAQPVYHDLVIDEVG